MASEGKFGRRLPPELRVRSSIVVIDPPTSKSNARLGQRREQRLVQQLIPQPPIEAFDEAILHAFARDLAPKFYPVLSSPRLLDLPGWAVVATGAGAEPSA